MVVCRQEVGASTSESINSTYLPSAWRACQPQSRAAGACVRRSRARLPPQPSQQQAFVCFRRLPQRLLQRQFVWICLALELELALEQVRRRRRRTKMTTTTTTTSRLLAPRACAFGCTPPPLESAAPDARGHWPPLTSSRRPFPVEREPPIKSGRRVNQTLCAASTMCVRAAAQTNQFDQWTLGGAPSLTRADTAARRFLLLVGSSAPAAACVASKQAGN